MLGPNCISTHLFVACCLLGHMFDAIGASSRRDRLATDLFVSLWVNNVIGTSLIHPVHQPSGEQRDRHVTDTSGASALVGMIGIPGVVREA